jgi:glycosyltransferase involved in cell wall biosynthesis
MNSDITIALPVYKRTDYIKSALDSAVNQTEKCEILIVDNGSPHDAFRQLAKSYDHEIRYVRNDQTVPQEENFNLCFRHAETPWVTILHDDDMLHCQYVEFSRKILDRYGDRVGGIMYKTYVAEEEWKEVSAKKDFPSDLKWLNPAYFHFFTTPFPGVLLKREEALEAGGFNRDLHPNADLDLWYRYASRNHFVLAEEEMAYFRISASQISSGFALNLINDSYLYRQKKIRESSQNNFLARLGLEFTRINNIQYYRDTYDDFSLPVQLPNHRAMNRAERLLRIRLIRSLVRRYVTRLSYSGT